LWLKRDTFMVLGVFIWGQIYGQRGTDLWSKGDRFSVDNFFIHRLWITFKRFDLDSLLIRIGLVIYITFSVFWIDVLLGMDSHLIYHLPTLIGW
ncbi:hypothetical protein FOF11_RS27060, partial [Escherichia coli]